MIDRYSSPDMRQLWSEQEKYRRWARVEQVVLAVVHGQETFLPVPTPKCVHRFEEVTHHDVAAFLDAVRYLLEDREAARLLHAGLTSSDLVDTALGWTLRDATGLVRAGLRELVGELYNRIDESQDAQRIARTHGRHAEPAPIGATFDRFALQFVHWDRLLWQRAWWGKVSGATGQYLTVSRDQEREILGQLGLNPTTGVTQVVPRWKYNELYFVLAEVAGTCADVATWVRLGSIQDVDEVWERQHPGQVGSTAMPAKTRNPIQSEKICGLARHARGLAGQLQDASHQVWWERDLTGSSLERTALPDLFATVEYLVTQTAELVQGLEFNTQVNEDRAQMSPSSVALWNATRAGADPVRTREEINARARANQPADLRADRSQPDHSVATASGTADSELVHNEVGSRETGLVGQ